jgi:hypothetical protein
MDPAHRVELLGVQRKVIQAAENCSASPEAPARALLSAIFTSEEINTGNCTSLGARTLNCWIKIEFKELEVKVKVTSE